MKLFKVENRIINPKMIDVIKLPNIHSRNILINHGQDRILLENVGVLVENVFHRDLGQDFYLTDEKNYINLNNLYSIDKKRDYMVLTFESGYCISVEGIDEKLIQEWEKK